MDTQKVFRHCSNKMLEEFSMSAQINHAGNKGKSRENFLKNFLVEGRLPLRYNIGSGEIVGPTRNVSSRQSDHIIYDQLNGYTLIYDESTQVYPIECVAGTIEVKSTLTKPKLIESLENIKSVKMLVPQEVVSESLHGFPMAYQRPLPFGAIFGYKLGGNSLASLVENLKVWEKENPKEYWPNVIAILGEGIIRHYKDGLKVAYTNHDLREAKFPSWVGYEKDTLFKFYSILMDLCTSTNLGPIELDRYFDQAEQIGNYLVTKHDRIVKPDCKKVFKLKEKFISKVVEHCRKEGPLTLKQFYLRLLGQIPGGVDPNELSDKVYFYNPDELKGIHEVKDPIIMCEGFPQVAEGVMATCDYITVNGDEYYFPQAYILPEDIEVIPGRTTDDL